MTPDVARNDDRVGMKQRLRQRLRASRDSLSNDARLQKSRAAGVLSLPKLAGARTVAVYSPKHSELDPAELIARLRERDCTIVYPRMVPSAMLLQFAQVDASDELAAGPFGVYEPGVHAPLVPLHSIDAFLVPGLSFDSEGNRLGWGKGYYDYTLAQSPRALRIGLCFHEQITPSLPCEATDQRMDWVVTDREAFAGPPRDRGHGSKVPS